MLEVRDLCAGYDTVDVLHDVNITAEAGRLTLVLGANGSGKSTLFRTISGLVRGRSGSITFEGKSISKLSSNRIVRAGIAHAPEGRHLSPS